jgi:hypothetical protein
MFSVVSNIPAGVKKVMFVIFSHSKSKQVLGIMSSVISGKISVIGSI